jgi:hypothetical protein
VEARAGTHQRAWAPNCYSPSIRQSLIFLLFAANVSEHICWKANSHGFIVSHSWDAKGGQNEACGSRREGNGLIEDDEDGDVCDVSSKTAVGIDQPLKILLCVTNRGPLSTERDS